VVVAVRIGALFRALDVLLKREVLDRREGGYCEVS